MDSHLKEVIYDHFKEEIDSKDRYLYFRNVYSSKELSKENISKIIDEAITGEISTPPKQTLEKGLYFEVDDTPVVFWDMGQSEWLLVYSSRLESKNRNKLDNISDRLGWLLDVWVPSDVVDDLYHEFSPDDEKVNIERTWDPYYIYQRTSDIPDSLQNYYNDNINEFVQQEIEFNLKTPQWMVDQALTEGVQEDLLEKSEISKSKFTFRSPEGKIRQDGGIQSQPKSKVTVKQGGQFVHRSGSVEATFDMMDEVKSKNRVTDEFEGLIPSRGYDEKEEGILDLSSYRQGGVLQVIFKKKEFNEEASIKLSNLLTVGQSDVELHGVIKKREELRFFAESHMSFDDGEYEVLFSGEDSPPFEPEFDQHACVYIKPISGTTPGLEYLYRKLGEKFDSRITHRRVSGLPLEELN